MSVGCSLGLGQYLPNAARGAVLGSVVPAIELVCRIVEVRTLVIDKEMLGLSAALILTSTIVHEAVSTSANTVLDSTVTGFAVGASISLVAIGADYLARNIIHKKEDVVKGTFIVGCGGVLLNNALSFVW